MNTYVDRDGKVYEDQPVARTMPSLTCRHCKTRAIISDGYGEYVHEDDYKYQCNPGKKNSTFAEVRHGRI